MCDKKFLTYDEQLKLLEQKGLIIEDKDRAICLLKEHSYFDLINGYKYPFKNKYGNYKRNTTFENIHLLYCFDDEIRIALIRAIMEVEIHIKSLLSYAFCEEFGSEEEQYLNRNNYDCSDDSVFNKFIETINNSLENNGSYSYIKHQREKYGNIPLWVLVKALTFGTISKMYSIQKPHIKKQISEEFVGINEKDLEDILAVLTKFRNVCVHNERLFDHKYYKRSITDTKIHEKLGIDKRNGQYVRGKSDLFAVVIGLKYLLPKESFDIFIDEIENAIKKLTTRTHQIQKAQLCKYMGFPDNWFDIKEMEK